MRNSVDGHCLEQRKRDNTFCARGNMGMRRLRKSAKAGTAFKLALLRCIYACSKYLIYCIRRDVESFFCLKNETIFKILKGTKCICQRVVNQKAGALVKERKMTTFNISWKGDLFAPARTVSFLDGFFFFLQPLLPELFCCRILNTYYIWDLINFVLQLYIPLL